MSAGRPGNRSVGWLPRPFRGPLTGLSLRECVHCRSDIIVVIDAWRGPKVCQPVSDTLAVVQEVGLLWDQPYDAV
jgi:hypothetical protein